VSRGGQESGDGPERVYVITGGRDGESPPDGLDLVTLVVARSQPEPGMAPEQTAIVRMCHYPLSVAEVSAYLELPVSAAMVLLADLLADGRLEARSPVPAAALPDIALLEAVMHGLQKL
jgi:hypothetical protein